MANRKKTDEEVDAFVAEGNPVQPEDTSALKDAEEAAYYDAVAEAATADAPEPVEVDFHAETPPGVSNADLEWWQLPQNRNYMAGDGPMASITEVDGSAQSASSVDPEIRAETLEESRQAEADAAAESAEQAPSEEE